MRALRAQISPHFIYNSLTAIASFVRTDPERARELLLEFADFTRYSLPPARRVHHARRGAALDRALPGAGAGPVRRPARRDRCGSRRRCCRSPCRSCACSRWSRTPSGTGSRARPAPGTITIIAEDADREAVISVEDDGVGRGPGAGTTRAGRRCARRDSVGLGNVDERLRSAFGDDYGLVVETAPGAGTKVTVRVPKYRAGGPRVMHRHELSGPARCWSSTTSAPALDELAFLLGRDERVAAVLHLRLGRGGAATCSQDEQVDAVFLDIADARARRPRPGRGAVAGSDPARRSSSSPPTTSTRSTPSTSTRSTTCSSRCATSGWPRRCAGSCDARGGGRPPGAPTRASPSSWAG